MQLIQTILSEIKRTISEGSPRIVACSNAGISCEGWLKVELLCRLALLKDSGIRVYPELGHTDLVVKTADETVLLELKTFPTNYGRGGKPITNFIAGVIADISKLSRKRTDCESGYCLWMTYPVPRTKREQWDKHLLKVREAAHLTVFEDQIQLLSDQYAHFYLMECPQEA